MLSKLGHFFHTIFINVIIAFQDSAVPPIKLLPRDKADNDKKNLEKITEAIEESKNGKLIGHFEKDKGFAGGFMDNWRNVQGKFNAQDMSNSMAYIMAPKVFFSFTKTDSFKIVCSYIFKHLGYTFSNVLSEKLDAPMKGPFYGL